MARLDHLALFVRDSARSRDWYVGTLGLRVEFEIPERKVVKFKPGKVMEDKITTPSMKGGIQPAPARKRENASESPRVSGEGSLS